MTKKKKNNPDEITVSATLDAYREAGTGIAFLCLWACSAFSMEPTLENAQAIYRMAQERAQDARTAVAFAGMWD